MLYVYAKEFKVGINFLIIGKYIIISHYTQCINDVSTPSTHMGDEINLLTQLTIPWCFFFVNDKQET